MTTKKEQLVAYETHLKRIRVAKEQSRKAMSLLEVEKGSDIQADTLKVLWDTLFDQLMANPLARAEELNLAAFLVYRLVQSELALEKIKMSRIQRSHFEEQFEARLESLNEMIASLKMEKKEIGLDPETLRNIEEKLRLL